MRPKPPKRRPRTNACLRRRVVTRNGLRHGLRSRFHPTSLCTTWIILASNSRLASNREFLSGLAPTFVRCLSYAEARHCAAHCSRAVGQVPYDLEEGESELW